jgi:protein-S-isoprenylcysteine O-methyltransferase Ste14
MSDLVETLARRRVTLGFVTALVAMFLAEPTWSSWRAGLVIALVGEALRIWAAGHLEKSREVTRSGPYRWFKHPLYVGSSIMTIGIVMASRSMALAIVAGVYMGVTIKAAILVEEAYLRRQFGDAYDRYDRATAEPMLRGFSIERALRNREYRAVLGLLIGFALLALKIMYR